MPTLNWDPTPGDHFSFRFYTYPYHSASSTFLPPLDHTPQHSNIVWKLLYFKETSLKPLSISSLRIISLLITKAKLLKPHPVFINHALGNPHHYTVFFPRLSNEIRIAKSKRYFGPHPVQPRHSTVFHTLILDFFSDLSFCGTIL